MWTLSVGFRAYYNNMLYVGLNGLTLGTLTVNTNYRDGVAHAVTVVYIGGVLTVTVLGQSIAVAVAASDLLVRALPCSNAYQYIVIGG